jgi:hypothetical protein
LTIVSSTAVNEPLGRINESEVYGDFSSPELREGGIHRNDNEADIMDGMSSRERFHEGRQLV